jgi:hypothetical protein
MSLSQFLIKFACLRQRLAFVIASEQRGVLAVDLERLSTTIKVHEQGHQALHSSFIRWVNTAKTIEGFDCAGKGSTPSTQVGEMQKETHPTALQGITASYSPIRVEFL